MRGPSSFDSRQFAGSRPPTISGRLNHHSYADTHQLTTGDVANLGIDADLIGVFVTMSETSTETVSVSPIQLSKR